MEKLLHERLREYGSNCRADYSEWMNQRKANELADEIERYYIPRPRFEDGEPAQWHEELENGEPLCTITYDDCGVVSINSDIVTPDYELINNETLKRPQPKVYDADGVEIKVGDTVWDKEGNKLEVKDIDPSNYPENQEHLVWCGAYRCGCKWWNIADQLTHKEPVLDADGIPINFWDKVWHIRGDGTWPYRVIDIKEGTVACITPKCPGITAWQDPKDLTHKEPDSIEKLRDDMEAWLEYPPMEAEGIAIGKWRDRLSALIERGA